MPVELTENAMRELVEIGQAVEKAGSREAVEVRLPKGVSVADENEIVVMVFSRGEGLAYARQVPEGALGLPSLSGAPNSVQHRPEATPPHAAPTHQPLAWHWFGAPAPWRRAC